MRPGLRKKKVCYAISSDEDYEEEERERAQKEEKPSLYADDYWLPTIKRRRRFTTEETKILENEYDINPNPPLAKIQAMAALMSTSRKIITTWFQNRRAKNKKRGKSTKEIDELTYSDKDMSSSTMHSLSDKEAVAVDSVLDDDTLNVMNGGSALMLPTDVMYQQDPLHLQVPVSNSFSFGCQNYYIQQQQDILFPSNSTASSSNSSGLIQQQQQNIMDVASSDLLLCGIGHNIFGGYAQTNASFVSEHTLCIDPADLQMDHCLLYFDSDKDYY